MQATIARVTSYDDVYPSCAGTCATLRIFCGRLDPDEVTARLGVEPTATQREVERPNLPPVPHRVWLLSSEDQLESKDLRRHLDWLLARLAGSRAALTALRAGGAMIDLGCVWLSANGRGGPTLSPAQMEALAALGLEVWFDVRLPEPGEGAE